MTLDAQESAATLPVSKEKTPWIPRVFVACAVLVVLGFGTMTILSVIRNNSPLSRITEKLVRSGRFEVLGFDWEDSWSIMAMEDAPWAGTVAGAIPASRINPLKGTVVVNLWASWCPPCRNELPSMFKLAREFKDKPVTFLFVTYDEGWDAPKALFKQVAGGMPRHVVNVRDPNGAPAGDDQPDDTMWKRLGATALPETFFVRDGKVVGKVIGEINWEHPDIKEYLRLIVGS